MNFWTYFLSVSFMPSWHLNELDLILAGAAAHGEPIDTVAFFGDVQEIERYIRLPAIDIIPKIIISQIYGQVNFKEVTRLNANAFFVAVGQLDLKARWYHMNEAFDGLQNHVRGVFITSARSKGSRFPVILEEHLKWCWQMGFTQVIVVIVDKENKEFSHKLGIFTYNPFFSEKILNVTAERQQFNLFPDKLRNLHRYSIRTCAFFDPPRVFERTECPARDNQILSGYVGNIFRAFVKEYNGQINLAYDLRNYTYNSQSVVALMQSGDIDVAINPFVPQKGIQLSYPIFMVQRCVVVPFARELPKYRYFMLPFDDKVWMCFLGMWLVMSLSRLLGLMVSHRRCDCHRSIDVSRIFTDVWRQIICLPIPGLCCSKALHWFSALWFIHILALGFVLSNLYLASLTSFFAGFTFERQTLLLEELVERQVPIETIDRDIPAILENRGLPKGFAELLMPRKRTELVPDIIALRENITYSALQDRIQFALSQQAHLVKPISHVVPECIATVPLGFMLPPQSLFEHSLNRFILRASSAGLLDKWYKESIEDAICSGILHMRKSTFLMTAPLVLAHFQFGWYVLAGGYMASLSIFLMENLQRITRRFRIFLIYY